MLATWRGLSGPFTVEQDDDECFFVKDDTGTIVATVEDFDEHIEAIARLFAGAPDDVKALAHTVIAQDADLARLRALVEQHEARAREHSDERAGLCAELARVTGERDAAEREYDALYDTVREWARAEDALTAAIVAADGRGTDDAYAAAVTRRNAAHVALRAATVTP